MIINENIQNYTINQFIDSYQYIKWYYSKNNLSKLTKQQANNAKYCHKHFNGLIKNFNQYYFQNKNKNFIEKNSSADYLKKINKSSKKGRTMAFIIWLLNGYINKHLTNLQIAYICKCTVRFVSYVISYLRKLNKLSKLRDKNSNYYRIVRLSGWTKHWIFEIIDELLHIYKHLKYYSKKKVKHYSSNAPDLNNDENYFNFNNN